MFSNIWEIPNKMKLTIINMYTIVGIIMALHTPKEANKLLFWNYHVNDNKPESISWKSGLHRYFEDEQAAQILRDIALAKKGTKDGELANRFYNHFCLINKINIEKLPAPNGALKRVYTKS